MSDSSLEEQGDANLEDFDFNPNKRQSEKKRREQENLYLEELSQLISANFPELRNAEDCPRLFFFYIRIYKNVFFIQQILALMFSNIWKVSELIEMLRLTFICEGKYLLGNF